MVRYEECPVCKQITLVGIKDNPAFDGNDTYTCYNPECKWRG
jgi:hypothetical protein